MYQSVSLSHHRRFGNGRRQRMHMTWSLMSVVSPLLTRTRNKRVITVRPRIATTDPMLPLLAVRAVPDVLGLLA